MKFLIALFTVLLTLDCGAQNLPLDTAIRMGKLPNGFTYYIRKNTEPAKRVQLYLVNKVGSVLENENQRGLAHFMEHMSFNGTTHFPKNDLVHYLQKSGVRFGADLNAYTGFDETVYQLPIPTDDPALLKNGCRSCGTGQRMQPWIRKRLMLNAAWCWKKNDWVKAPGENAAEDLPGYSQSLEVFRKASDRSGYGIEKFSKTCDSGFL